MTCQTCAHFLAQTDEQGLCRRYPPTPIYTPEGINSIFPQMLKDGLCGEYKEKTDETRLD